MEIYLNMAKKKTSINYNKIIFKLNLYFFFLIFFKYNII